jgi:hypothetical protein
LGAKPGALGIWEASAGMAWGWEAVWVSVVIAWLCHMEVVVIGGFGGRGMPMGIEGMNRQQYGPNQHYPKQQFGTKWANMEEFEA